MEKVFATSYQKALYLELISLFFDDLYKGIYSVKDCVQGVGQTATSIADLMKELINIKIKVGYVEPAN